MSDPTIPSWRRAWLDPAWQAEVLGWAETELSALGRAIRGPVEQPHLRPWATAFRIPTDGGVAWLKATAPGPSYEGRLLEVFRARGVTRVVLPLATHPARPWTAVRRRRPHAAPDAAGRRRRP